MDIDCSQQELFLLKKIARCAQNLDMPAFLIGGFVRDKLLNRQSKDMDIVCIGDCLPLAESFAALFHPKPAVAYFKNFGTAQVKITLPTSKRQEPWQFDVEFVGARKESYQVDSRKPSVLPGTLEDDQLRRDFTINALAISLNKENYGVLLDPFNGLPHLFEKYIITPGDPNTTFKDDPLRMMRAIRFSAQLNFHIAAPTWKALIDNKERIRIISQERITDELNKIMCCKQPSLGWNLLFTSGLLDIIFPELSQLHGTTHIDGKGHKDNFYHTLQVLDNICAHTNDLWLRWAALLHDIAKPATKRYEEGHGFTFHGHEVVGAKMVPKIFARLKLPMHEAMRRVQKLVLLHLRPISLTKENITDSAIRRLLFDAGEDIDDLMMLCEADITSKNKWKVKKYLANYNLVKQRMEEVEKNDHLRNWQPPISGEMIMQTFNLPPGRIVGTLKDAIRNAILDGQLANNFEAAHTYLLKLGLEYGLQPVPAEMKQPILSKNN
jgi:putative nucleotidyltransferase with HDIG domain